MARDKKKTSVSRVYRANALRSKAEKKVDKMYGTGQGRTELPGSILIDVYNQYPKFFNTLVTGNPSGKVKKPRKRTK